MRRIGPRREHVRIDDGPLIAALKVYARGRDPASLLFDGSQLDFASNFRVLLQVWGSEFRRNLCGERYWLKKMETIIEASREHYDVLFVTDVRFANEADLIKGLGGKIIRVTRRVDVYDTYPNGVDEHSSEVALDSYPDYDYVLDNDKTRDMLKDAVSKMLHTLGLHDKSA